MHNPLDTVSHGLAFLAGIVILISVTVSLLRTVVVPRPLRSNYSDLVTATVIGTTRLIARTRPTYKDKDAVLSWGGPILIVAMLVSWLLGYLLAYTLLEFGASADRTVEQAFRQAGSNLFTLGMGGMHDGVLTIIDFMAAATGPIVIAMLIGFLPSVYSSYLDRERVMAEVGIVAGEPMWAPEWLARASLAGSLGNLVDAMPQYADWATNLRMTHATYPVLQFMRSARYTRHHIVTLLAMLDAANLLASVSTKVPHRQLFIMILNGSQALWTLQILFYSPRRWRSRVPILGRFMEPADALDAQVYSIPAWQRDLAAVHLASARDAARGMAPWRHGDDAPREVPESQLSRAEFDAAITMMREAGMTIDRDEDEAWAMFHRIRSRYEFPAYEIARALSAVPAPWSGPRNVDLPTIWPNSAVEIRRSDTGPGDGASAPPDRSAEA